MKNLDKPFICQNCQYTVHSTLSMGTNNRNHCPRCLWSKHVDNQRAGDRLAPCFGMMEPIGLTFKQTHVNKYNPEDRGELMVIHHCIKCDRVSINRLAADDQADKVLLLLESPKLVEFADELKTQGIEFLTKESSEIAKKQLYGKTT